MFVTVLAPELLAAVAPLSAIGGQMAGGYGTLAGAHAGLLPSSADPTALMTHMFLHAHHLMAQGMGAEGIGVHYMTVATMGLAGTSYLVGEAANMATMF